MNKVYSILIWLNIWRVIPGYILFRTNRFKDKCLMDLEQWEHYDADACQKTRLMRFGYFMIICKECRNIFLNRLRGNILTYAIGRILFPPLQSCYLNIPPEDLGGGFSLQHGFSTIVAAKRIGERCRVNQQVTIGYDSLDAPVLGDDVRVTAGAIIIGDVHIGDGAVIGAGAVVVHDVPANATVVGNAARVVKIREIANEIGKV